MAMRYARLLAALCVAAAAYGAYVLACSQGPTYALFVNPVYPEAAVPYAQGELGIVQPTFARWYLVEAYRRMKGLPDRSVEPLELDGPPAEDTAAVIGGWLNAREAILKTGKPVDPDSVETTRREQFFWFDNCGVDAVRTAAATLAARTGQFGAASVEVQDWLAGQDAVFMNCGDGAASAVLPPAPTSSHALIRADRAYQTASALFYAMDYDAAAARFQAIDADRQSPWRKYGRYLSARTRIRKATLVEKDPDAAAGAFDAAEKALQGVLADGTLRDMHSAARRLLGFVAVQHRPMQRLHELSTLLAGRTMAWQDLRDYTWLMDRFVGNTSDYEYAALTNREQLTAADDLTDWIVTVQAKGDASLAHAIERWRATRATPWLTAVLWKVPATHAEADRILAAAADVRSDSPAFLTVAFLRVRLLTWMNRRDAARRVLADLPSQAGAGVPQGVVNLFLAERLMLAPTLDAFAAAIARQPIGDYPDGFGPPGRLPPAPPSIGVPSLDRDAAVILTERMPLDRLADLAESPRIPMRLRVRIAAAAWTRAVLLRRDAVGSRVVPVLTNAGSGLAANLEPYIRAGTPSDRHYAGILALVRTAGLAAYISQSDVPGDTDDPTGTDDAEHSSSEGWWWCGFKRNEGTGLSGAYQGGAPSVFPAMLYADTLPPFPEFLTAQERSAADAEFEQLVALGTAPNYLADEAAAWARARPRDEAAAEALALAIVGTRWGCTDPSTGSHSQRAFATLHRLFPNTRWAKQTKYWYAGR